MNKAIKELFEDFPRMDHNFYLTIFKNELLEKFIGICYYADQRGIISVMITK